VADNQEILTKAIEKAIAGGWEGELDRLSDDEPAWIVVGNSHILLDDSVPAEVLFSHSFAKALWGEEEQAYELHIPFGRDGLNIKYVSPKWQYHLQQMVIADDPIKYLEENYGI
jgi:hypothetical protein